MRTIGIVVVSLILLAGCAGKQKTVDVLAAPPGTVSAAAAAVDEGNRLFRMNRFAEARAQYEAALSAQPNLAEAHYNLARSLDYLGDPAGARSHYLEAANLAPGHKIIWDSPPLRGYGQEAETMPKRSAGAPPVMPALGGMGGGGGGGRSGFGY